MKFSSVVLLLASPCLAAAALAPASAHTTDAPTASTPARADRERSPALAPIPLAEMPLGLHRRAARHLEAMRQTSDSVWFDARLGDRATPMSRPGVAGVAHYEVPVEDAGGEPLGYILLSTGEHDFPIVSSASGGLPASEQLEALAGARGERLARLWVLGTNSYVGENDRGERVAELGALPPRLEGVSESILDLPSEERAVRVVHGPDGSPELRTPPAIQQLRHSEWGSWAELRAALDDPRSLNAAIARRNAAPFWQAERDMELLPAKLEPLEIQRVPLLARGRAEVDLSGPGARHVTSERIDDERGDAWLSLRVASSPPSVRELSVAIRYAGGGREVLGFAVPARPAAMPRTPIFGQTFPLNCSRVALRTHNGRYVRVVEGGVRAVDARADRVGPWELFDLEQLPGGEVALRSSSSGAYLEPVTLGTNPTAGGGGVTAERGWRGPAHHLRPVPAGGGTFALRTASGHHLVAEGGGGGNVNANRPQIGAWEKFQVLCNPPAPNVYFADHRDERTAWRMQRKYRQLRSHEAPNTIPCATGCGATAWAMLIGYVDNAAASGIHRWSPFQRMYLHNGGRGKVVANTVAPEWQDGGINRITLELRAALGDIGTGCEYVSGQRFTVPHVMAQASRYFWGRVPAYATAAYDGAYISTSAGVNKLRHSLEVERRVVAVGVGYHYPVAWGLRRASPPRWDPAQNKWVDFGAVSFFVDTNYGWAESHSHSVPLATWFHGDIITAPYSRVQQVAQSCSVRATGGGPTGRLDHDYKCTTHFKNSERFVGFEVAERLVERDVLPAARAHNRKVCVLDSTDLQCAPCSTTDRLIVRMDVRAATSACPSNTVNELR